MSHIAFLSTAHIHTQQFIHSILESKDGRKVVAIWDDEMERGQKYAAMANAPFVEDIDQILQQSDVDGFIICAENTRHFSLLKKVIPMGKPILCEKPLLTRSAHLPEIRSLLKQYKSPVCCGYFIPFQKEMQAILQLLKEDALGTVTHVRFVNAHHAAYGKWFDDPDLSWFRNPALAGGGAFMDLGTHAIHLLRTFFGPVDQVWAHFMNQSGIYGEVEDYGVAHLQFASGILGEVEAAWTQTGGINGLTIVGSKASVWNTSEGYVVGEPGGTPKLIPPIAELPTRVDRLVEMIRGRISEEALRADMDAICDTVKIMDTAFRAAKEGEWKRVDEVEL